MGCRKGVAHGLKPVMANSPPSTAIAVPEEVGTFPDLLFEGAVHPRSPSAHGPVGINDPSRDSTKTVPRR